MLQGVLFDLDGTLLDIEFDEFFARYFGAMEQFAGPQFPGVELMPAIMAGTRIMMGVHPGRTNREAFYEDFRARTGVDLTDAWPVFGEFYRDVFPRLGDGYGPAAGAREAIEAARALGLKVAVATQPIFPAEAIAHRLAWAQLSDIAFDAVTTYEVMCACKPLPAYFRQTAGMMGCDPGACLMVGDDRGNDMPASATGMRTFYVGRDAEAPADFRGTLRDLPALLQRLTASGDESGA